MTARIGWPAIVRQAGEIAGRRGHDLLIMLMMLLLGALAMITAEAWMAEHLIVFRWCRPAHVGRVLPGTPRTDEDTIGSDPAAAGLARGARSGRIASGHAAAGWLRPGRGAA